MTQTVAVWSPKGGVGKSILAAAVALKLAERQRTALIDGNADNPDLVNLLQCPATPNVTGWAPPDEPTQVESLLVRHSGRLWVLPGPPRYVESESLTGPVMESVITSCQAADMAVVVDLGSALRDSTLAALDLADRVWIPVTLDLLAVAPLRRFCRELDLLQLPRQKFRVVINRHTNTREITVEDVRHFSELPVEAIIPSARDLAAAVNRGELAGALAGGSPVGKAVARLVEPLADQAEAVRPERAGTLSRLIAGLRGGGS